MSSKENVDTGTTEQPSYLAVRSTDGKFMHSLINWLNRQHVKKDSTIVRVHDTDPYEEVDLLRAQIEGMTTRINDVERKAEAHTKLVDTVRNAIAYAGGRESEWGERAEECFRILGKGIEST